MKPQEVSASIVVYSKVAITQGYAKGSYSNSKLLKYHIQSTIKYFGKWVCIYDSERRRLNENPAPLTHDHPALESAA